MIPSPSLRVLHAIGRVAARTFAHLRSVVEPCRAIRFPALPHRAFMVQQGPCAVTVISSAYPLSVQICHRGLLRVEDHSTPDGSADAQIVFAGFANGHG